MKPVIKEITSEHISLPKYVGKVVKFRSLILVFAWQELKAQYSQTMLGVLWAILRPLMILLIFTFIFDKLVHIPGMQSPYPVFVFSGLIAWNYFSFLVTNGGNALVSNQQIVRKIYFPKIILILAKALVGGVEFLISLLLMLALMVGIHFPITTHIIWLPLFILLNTITGITVAIWLNAFSVRFRDVNQFIPQLIGFLVWLTPVFYPATIIPASLSFLIFYNPLAGIIQGYRYALLGESFYMADYLFVFTAVCVCLIIGLFIFIRAEDEMADYL